MEACAYFGVKEGVGAAGERDVASVGGRFAGIGTQGLACCVACVKDILTGAPVDWFRSCLQMRSQLAWVAEEEEVADWQFLAQILTSPPPNHVFGCDSCCC